VLMSTTSAFGYNFISYAHPGPSTVRAAPKMMCSGKATLEKRYTNAPPTSNGAAGYRGRRFSGRLIGSRRFAC